MNNSKFKELIVLAMLGALTGSISVSAMEKDFSNLINTGEDLSELSPEEQLESDYNYEIETLTKSINDTKFDLNKLNEIRSQVNLLITKHESDREKFSETKYTELKNKLDELKKHIDEKIEHTSKLSPEEIQHLQFNEALDDFTKAIDNLNENQNDDDLNLTFDENELK